MLTAHIEPHGEDLTAGAGGTASPWNLCFLSGPMYGRTMSLARGMNWIGTAADCDVILPDREIGPKQVCLRVGGLVVSVQNVGAGAATVMLNNEPLGAARRSMTAQDVLSIGSMRVGITRNPQAASAMPAGDLEPVSEPEAAWLGRLRTLLDGATSRSVVLVVAALWIGALMGAVGYAFASWSGHLPWQPESALTQAHRLQQRLRAYPELSVTPRNDGVVVSGYVNDGTARDQVAQIVTSTDRAALDNVYVVTDLVATAQTYFSDTALTVKYMGRGRIELTGTAERAKIEPRIRNYMKDARPALELVDHVRDAQLNAPRSATLGGTDGIPEITTVFASNGDRRYIETVDGTRYFEGAKLKDGPTLVSIDSEQIIFEQNGRRITIPLGGVKPPQVLPATRNG